mgnify:CR=1 FL=1
MTAPTGAVYDRGYRPYDGPRGGRRAATMALFRTSLRRAIGLRRPWRQKVAPAVLLAGNGHVRLDYGVGQLFAALRPQARVLSVGFLEAGERVPQFLKLTAGARSIQERWMRAVRAEEDSATGVYLAFLGKLSGIDARDPAFGMEAVWIEPGSRDHAQTLGYTVVDASTVIATNGKPWWITLSSTMATVAPKRPRVTAKARRKGLRKVMRFYLKLMRRR